MEKALKNDLLQQRIMSEIFLIGVMVSMVKIMSMADIEFGVSFWAYGAFVISYIALLLIQ